MKTRITELLGIEHPIFQAAMSWASSNSALVIAVSNAGGLGVLADMHLEVGGKSDRCSCQLKAVKQKA